MSDPRLTPFSGRVAHSSLKGQIAAPEFSAGHVMRLGTPLADLLRSPSGPRDRQILQGAQLCQLDTLGEMAYVQALADGYCGWVARAALRPDHPVTHRVRAPATHIYDRPDLKSPELASLSLNAQVQITGEEGAFLRSPVGWLPRQHLAPLDQPERDPVAVAESLVGTPYLWGGNSRSGLDCSALVQLALHACNHPCPGDSDLQQEALGPALPKGTPPKRGDLLFWRGHVAWVCAPDMILHATAYSMSVLTEPMAPALARIAQTSPLAAHIRPD